MRRAATKALQIIALLLGAVAVGLALIPIAIGIIIGAVAVTVAAGIEDTKKGSRRGAV